MKSLQRTIIWITIFSIAMGFLETAVVIYVRHLVYGDGGLYFPLQPVGMGLAITELLREASTIMMLIIIGKLTGRNSLERFAYFIYSFAIWDIFYYVFLKLLVNWPASIFSWDILFLIPLPWTGPVISPVMLSLLMIFLALSILIFREKGYRPHVSRKEWLLMISGCVVSIISFMWDYITFILQRQQHFVNKLSLSSTSLLSATGRYVPQDFNWPLFITGLSLLLLGILHFVTNTLRKRKELAAVFS